MCYFLSFLRKCQNFLMAILASSRASLTLRRLNSKLTFLIVTLSEGVYKRPYVALGYKSSRRAIAPVAIRAPPLCGGLTGERKLYYDANIYHAPALGSRRSLWTPNPSLEP